MAKKKNPLKLSFWLIILGIMFASIFLGLAKKLVEKLLFIIIPIRSYTLGAVTVSSGTVADLIMLIVILVIFTLVGKNVWETFG